MERKDVDLYSYLSLPFYQVVQYPSILQKILKVSVLLWGSLLFEPRC